MGPAVLAFVLGQMESKAARQRFGYHCDCWYVDNKADVIDPAARQLATPGRTGSGQQTDPRSKLATGAFHHRRPDSRLSTAEL